MSDMAKRSDKAIQLGPQHKLVVTTDPRRDHPVAPNVLDRAFQAAAPDRLWTAEITSIPTRQGWLSWVVVMGLFSRRIVGWAGSWPQSAASQRPTRTATIGGPLAPTY
jgi:transposase InsO family protein